MTKKLASPAIAVILGATVLLSGCTFRIADPQAKPEDRPTNSVAAPSPSSTPQQSDDGSERERLEDLVSVTLQCEPEMEITQTGATVRIEGDCDTLTISADAAVVIADDVTSLLIVGSGVVAYVGSVETLRVSGDANTVRWSGSTPAVDDSGAGNTLGKDN